MEASFPASRVSRQGEIIERFRSVTDTDIRRDTSLMYANTWFISVVKAAK